MRIAALLGLICFGAAAQTVPQILSTLSATVQYRESVVSPDGRWLAYVAGGANQELSVLDLSRPGASPRKIGAGQAVAFSPDSRQIAFLSDSAAKKGQLEVYTQALDQGGAKKLTSLTGFLAEPRWSPDGNTIALLFTENAPRAAGPLEPSTKESGVIEEKFYEPRLALVDVKSGQVRQITPADTYVYEYDWAPDSSRLAYTASKGNGDNNWWIARLFTIPAAGGEPKLVEQPSLQIANPRWSPDGTQIAYIGGIMSDEGSTGGDIYVVAAEGGGAGGSKAKDVTPGRKSSPSWLQWMKSGKILFTESIDGGTALATLDTATGTTETLWNRDETVAGLTVSDDGGTFAAVRSSWAMAPEIWAGPRGEWTARTKSNASLKPLWGEAKKLHWQSDGAEVEGWLLFPVNYNPSRKYPMVVSVHGGPAAARKAAWPYGHFDMSVMSSQGYFVLFPNPRGSYGAGEAFTHANVKDFGYGDLHDIEAGVDQAVASYPIDAARVGIAGWSYGGYMTMWAVTKSTRFHAAVAGAGISDWQSYYGENLIDQWMIPYFGKSVYDDPEVYARSSPMTYIKNVKTPTLILVGDSDAECPAPQSYEFWHALRTLGVKTQLVVYPNEGHRVRQPEHVRDILERSIGWFNENLK
jgi:dipeptidyl aminopeptidase/acylaminoacyl peptidase